MGRHRLVMNQTCKLYSRDFSIFPPNVIKIDRYDFELYCFKVGAFFETQCSHAVRSYVTLDPSQFSSLYHHHAVHCHHFKLLKDTFC